MKYPKNKSNTFNNAIRRKLNFYMGKKNLTQYKLAQLSNVPYSTIKNIMQGRTNSISAKTLILLVNGLGIPLYEFFNDECFLIENLDLD